MALVLESHAILPLAWFSQTSSFREMLHFTWALNVFRSHFGSSCTFYGQTDSVTFAHSVVVAIVTTRALPFHLTALLILLMECCASSVDTRSVSTSTQSFLVADRSSSEASQRRKRKRSPSSRSGYSYTHSYESSLDAAVSPDFRTEGPGIHASKIDKRVYQLSTPASPTRLSTPAPTPVPTRNSPKPSMSPRLLMKTIPQVLPPVTIPKIPVYPSWQMNNVYARDSMFLPNGMETAE